MKLFWGSDLRHVAGNAYGYYIHNNTLKEYVQKIYPLEESINTATDAIYILPPEIFEKVERYGETKIWLFTMFEGTIIPEYYLERISKADYFLTPSTWVKSVFENYYKSNRIFVVNHGVESVFKYKKRKFPHKKPFRYLWVGAPNPRKGYEEIVAIWKAFFQGNDRFELYIKSTRVDEVLKRKYGIHNGVRKVGNVILDGRDLTRKRLVKLYHQSHCFVFPTRGEGFGLTLAEAMRTGLPCIATNYSGVTDFFNDMVGYPVDYKLGEGVVTFIGDKREEKTEIAYPLPDKIAEAMVEVYSSYSTATKKAKRASQFISSQFRWEHSAKRLIEVIGGDIASE